MTYGLIVCAGKQTRFKSQTPKALIKLKDECLLDINIKVMSKLCDEIYVVVSHENKDYFNNYKTIEIESGFGCGDAVMKALQSLDIKNDDYACIAWGDTLLTDTIIDSLIEPISLGYNSIPCIFIPCTYEEHPYVLLDNGRVYFSKYGEETYSGFHDLSTFYGNAMLLRNYLEVLSRIYMVDGKYVNKHGNEMNFLDVFNDTCLDYCIIDVKGYKDKSFNTLEDLSKLEERM